jgi:GH43 family beta-xylosidase
MFLYLLCGHAFAMPDIGDKIEVVPEDPIQGLIIRSSQILPFIERTYDGIDYYIAFTEEEHRIEYISTTDTRYRTIEGIAVGSTLQDVLKASDSAPMNERGWSSFVELSNGWFAAFGLEPLSPTSKVEWLFKRR